MIERFLLGGAAAGVSVLLLMACTQEAPRCRMVGGAGSDRWLMIGNSLLHDHDWSDLDGPVQNCAVRGQTASAARRRALPHAEEDPTHVLLAFGTVEAVRAVRDTPFDPEGFAADVTALARRVSGAWPGACLLVATPPPASPSAADQDALGQAEVVLRALEPAVLIDTSGALRHVPVPTYDGVHLTGEAYASWSVAVSDAAARRCSPRRVRS